MLEALIEVGHLQRGDEVLLPAMGWSTDLFSVAQAEISCHPRCPAQTLCLEANTNDRYLPFIYWVVLEAGSPLLLEDACAAHGAK